MVGLDEVGPGEVWQGLAGRAIKQELKKMIERPLDPPEAWGCEFCNPESVDEDTDIAVCEHQDPNSPCFCTRPEGHDDDEHAFCVAYRHPLKTWS